MKRVLRVSFALVSVGVVAMVVQAQQKIKCEGTCGLAIYGSGLIGGDGEKKTDRLKTVKQSLAWTFIHRRDFDNITHPVKIELQNFKLRNQGSAVCPGPFTVDGVAAVPALPVCAVIVSDQERTHAVTFTNKDGDGAKSDWYKFEIAISEKNKGGYGSPVVIDPELEIDPVHPISELLNGALIGVLAGIVGTLGLLGLYRWFRPRHRPT